MVYFDPPIVPLFRRVAVPSAVRCCTVLLLLCFLIVGIHASVQRIDLRTTRRRSHGEPCIRAYCLFFKYLHVEISNNRGYRAPHGCVVSLFVNLYLFLTDIPPLLNRRSQRREQPQEESLSLNLNPPPFYLMSKEFRSLSAAA